MFKNQHGFGSGQGNYASGHNFYLYIAFVLTLAALVLIGMFRFKIRNGGEKKEKGFYVFKKEKHFGMFIGALIVLTQVIRLIFFLDYVNKGELLSLHLCRLHIAVLGLILLVGKPEKVKYIAIMAILGVIFAFIFGNLSTGKAFNNYDHDKIGTGEQVEGDKALSHTEKLLLIRGYKFYNVGPDNFFFGEYFFAHIAIAIIPAFIGVARHDKLPLKEFFIMQVSYMGLTFVAGAFDGVTDGLKDQRGNANLGYIGTNPDNDMSHALGGLSEGPQNLITYGVILGQAVTGGLYLIMLGATNVIGFEDGKIAQYKQSKRGIGFKHDFRKIVLRKKHL